MSEERRDGKNLILYKFKKFFFLPFLLLGYIKFLLRLFALCCDCLFKSLFSFLPTTRPHFNSLNETKEESQSELNVKWMRMEAQVELERRTSLAISHEIIFSFDFEFVSSSHSYSRESRGNREKNLAMGKREKVLTWEICGGIFHIRNIGWTMWRERVSGEDDGGFWASHKLYYFTLRHEKKREQQ